MTAEEILEELKRLGGDGYKRVLLNHGIREPCFGVRISEMKKIGQVTADMDNTACQIPFAPDYIRKVQAQGRVGKKRKTAKC